jgi:hypothetical protein
MEKLVYQKNFPTTQVNELFTLFTSPLVGGVFNTLYLFYIEIGRGA